MSITFFVPQDDRIGTLEVNMSNSNAYEVMQWVGIVPDYCGEVKATELAALCRRRLWDVARNYDPALPAHQEGNIIFCGRANNYLRNKAKALLCLAEGAIKLGQTNIHWG